MNNLAEQRASKLDEENSLILQKLETSPVLSAFEEALRCVDEIDGGCLVEPVQRVRLTMRALLMECQRLKTELTAQKLTEELGSDGFE